MIRIFVSYRHQDERDLVNKIADYLADRLDPDEVFIDKQGLIVGDELDFVKTKVRQSDVLLVMIGPRWLDIWGEKIKENTLHEDWVRVEIETGLQTDGVLVIPVLLNGAKMPKADHLPNGLGYITGKLGATVSYADFDNDMAKLLDRIKRRHARYCGATRVHDEFPTHGFRKRLGRTRDRARILVIWTSLLNFFSEQLIAAVRNGAEVQILLLSPDSICATQRDRDLHRPEGYTATKIRQNVDDLRLILDDLRHMGINAEGFAVRYYDATPSRTVYMADETAFIGTHAPGIHSINTHHTEVYGKETSLFQSIDVHFERLWAIGTPVEGLPYGLPPKASDQNN